MSASAGMGVSVGAVNELRGWGFSFGWPKNKIPPSQLIYCSRTRTHPHTSTRTRSCLLRCAFAPALALLRCACFTAFRIRTCSSARTAAPAGLNALRP